MLYIFIINWDKIRPSVRPIVPVADPAFYILETFNNNKAPEDRTLFALLLGGAGRTDGRRIKRTSAAQHCQLRSFRFLVDSIIILYNYEDDDNDDDGPGVMQQENSISQLLLISRG